MDVRQGGLSFFRGERIQYPTFCITRSKGGRSPSTLLRAMSLPNGASSILSTIEEELSARIFAARLTTSLCLFLADHFFRSEKKSTCRTPVACLYKYDYIFMSFTIIYLKTYFFIDALEISMHVVCLPGRAKISSGRHLIHSRNRYLNINEAKIPE